MIFFKTPVHFLHIGKTGGTSIISQMKRFNQLKDCPYHFYFYNHQVALKHLPPGQKYFFAVRDPVERFVSGFYSTKFQNKGIPWTTAEKTAFEIFPEANHLAESLFSDSSLGLLAYDAMQSIKHVAEFQIEWFAPAAQIPDRLPIAVLNQKTLEYDFNQMLNKLGLPPVMLPTENQAAIDNFPPLSDQAVKNIKIWYQRDIKLIEYLTQLTLD